MRIQSRIISGCIFALQSVRPFKVVVIRGGSRTDTVNSVEVPIIFAKRRRTTDGDDARYHQCEGATDIFISTYRSVQLQKLQEPSFLKFPQAISEKLSSFPNLISQSVQSNSLKHHQKNHANPNIM